MISDWMKSLVIYLILSGIIVNLTPSGNYKRYISFFTGLVVIIIMARPLIYVFRFGAVDIDKIVNDMEYSMKNNQYINNETETYNYYEMGVSGGIEKSLISSGFDIEGVDVITNKNGEIYRCYVYVNKESGIDSDESIKNAVNDVYYVDLNNIYIVRR